MISQGVYILLNKLYMLSNKIIIFKGNSPRFDSAIRELPLAEIKTMVLK